MAFRMVPTVPVRINRPVRKVGPPVRMGPTIPKDGPVGTENGLAIDPDFDPDFDLDRPV
jgi:hypothetical protein